jgi:hypothetical protein
MPGADTVDPFWALSDELTGCAATRSKHAAPVEVASPPER